MKNEEEEVLHIGNLFLALFIELFTISIASRSETFGSCSTISIQASPVVVLEKSDSCYRVSIPALVSN